MTAAVAHRVRVVYVDVDGTLVGPGGSMFAGPTGPSGRAAQAIARLHEAGVDVVPVSGRSRDQMSELARLIGARAYVAELGALLVERDGGEHLTENFGEFPGRGRPAEAIARSGAAAFLLERFAGRLELHTPWALRPRTATMLLRGLVEPEEAAEALRRAGYRWLALRDNGALRGTYPHLESPEAHVYNLAPRGVTKASALRLHRERHSLAREDVAAVGDSPADMEMALEVGTMFLVGSTAVPPDTPGDVVAIQSPAGHGFAEAVERLLG